MTVLYLITELQGTKEALKAIIVHGVYVAAVQGFWRLLRDEVKGPNMSALKEGMTANFILTALCL